MTGTQDALGRQPPAEDWQQAWHQGTATSVRFPGTREPRALPRKYNTNYCTLCLRPLSKRQSTEQGSSDLQQYPLDFGKLVPLIYQITRGCQFPVGSNSEESSAANPSCSSRALFAWVAGASRCDCIGDLRLMTLQHSLRLAPGIPEQVHSPTAENNTPLEIELRQG